MRPRFAALAMAYAALLAYGSLFPFAFEKAASLRMLDVLSVSWPARYSSADVITNVLAYMPLGLLLVFAWRGSRSLLPAMLGAILAGTALSFSMELLQELVPGRVASLLDVAMNATGTFIGALLATALRPDRLPGQVLLRWRVLWIKPGRRFDLGLCALGLWALSQWTPLVPSLDIGNLRQGLRPLWQTLQHPERFQASQFAAYALSIGGLALLFSTLANPGRRARTLFFSFVTAVLLYKIPVVGRQLSLEAVAGAAVGALIALPLVSLRAKRVAWVSATLIGGGFVCAELASDPAGRLYAFNWVPFRGQMTHTLIGFASILETLWVAVALAYLARFVAAGAQRGAIAWAGGAAFAGAVFALEWNQQFLPGRLGDITTVLLAAGAWAAAWGLGGGKDVPDALAPSRASGWIVAGITGLASAGGAFALVIAQPQREVRVDESKLPQLPAAESLPPVRLRAFVAAHPRLPHPTLAELAILRKHNPQWLRRVREQAAGGRGDLHATALQELAEPGSVDLGLLHGRLMALEFNWRGHEQGKPLAVAYDWLHAQWSESQRAELRGKVAQGCEYLIHYIRKERLSPYNVILYNSPLQALMACSIALYGDDPRGEAIMAFTQDLWKNRVLPVWKQVMGRNGGWHEGGEYVGIGIGQAIYSLPAMWRIATGEDLFITESGIPGFLDFLIYRTRPDGSDFRWGDGAYFNREVPDARALAFEYRHRAYLSRTKPLEEPEPTAWPWGPLTDGTLYDPEAIDKLPLTRYFDGIGMVVARSDWSSDATYVTFKAGDNYWSHVHLDQGAFTIYKGGPLAIDSGLYGPKYGSDHHMNYAYQTIAHNTVTVTDPDDTVPAPRNGNELRAIANDGGQRRVGSGWGVEAAPLDLEEWRAKAAVYRTGRTEKVIDEEGLLIAVADLTAAYTNDLSGKGTFSHRTRRVEKFRRVFVYDRVDDAIVVFDDVRSTKAEFRKRWLVHSVKAPRVTPGGFSISTPPQDRHGWAGGRLDGYVILPKNANVNAIGGPGFEFFVDGKNYDEDGKIRQVGLPPGPGGPEPGAWRIEVMPKVDALTDRFLVVLLPTLGQAAPSCEVKRIEAGDESGAEVICPIRSLRFTFNEAARIRVDLSQDGRHLVAHRFSVGQPGSDEGSSWRREP